MISENYNFYPYNHNDLLISINQFIDAEHKLLLTQCAIFSYSHTFVFSGKSDLQMMENHHSIHSNF